jgi:methylisocitrate lyase
MGRADGRVTLDEALAHLRAVAGAVDVPVNADFEGGFAVAPEDVGRNVALAADTGVAGLSIEDSTGDVDDPLFEFELAVDRVRAARAAIDASGTGIVLTGRSEGFIAGRPDLDETIRRLRAYADAGADCLYAPGISTREQITAVVQAIAPKPVNVLVWGGFLSVAELAELGVRRISTGSRLAASAWGAAIRAANEIAEHGTFDGLKEAPASAEIVRGFTGD